MGNNQGGSDKQHQVKKNESYRQVYGYLCNESGFMRMKFKEYFCEIPQLGGNLFHFFSLFRHHTYETFVEIIEILTKYEPELHINVEARQIVTQTSIFDRFAMILLGIYDVKAYLEHTCDQKVKLEIITNFFQLFTRKINHDSILKAYEYLEPQAKETQNTKLFIEGFREKYPYAQQHLVSYYKAKFTTITPQYFGIKDPESKVLSVEDWIILSMKAPKIKQNVPTLLFSADKHGISFSSLQSQIIGYTGAWLLVLSHTETDPDTKEKVKYIIGSYQNSPIKDVHNYQGSMECFIFRITPSIKYLSPDCGQGQSNFFSIYGLQGNKQRRRGLGFGGRDFQNYKLWIDEDIEDKSYVSNGPDLTYGYGFIASPGTEKLKIRDFEIWGLGTTQNLKEYEEYKKDRAQEATRRRKVNKQELVSGMATELLFEKTFGHRDQVQGDLEHDKQQQK